MPRNRARRKEVAAILLLLGEDTSTACSPTPGTSTSTCTTALNVVLVHVLVLGAGVKKRPHFFGVTLYPAGGANRASSSADVSIDSTVLVIVMLPMRDMSAAI